MDSTDFHIELNPAVIVIFGITGDLSTRKLLPSLYQLTKNGLLHDKTRILGVTRREVDLSDLLDKAKLCVREQDGECDDEALAQLEDRIELYQMNAAEADGYPGLKDYLDKIEDEVGMCVSRLFYLSIPPQISTPIIRHLGEQGLNHGCQKHGAKARLLLEKPFGFDMRTAEELVAETTKHFEEGQIFRIDHYLAKETVQNIVTFRFRNPIFEDIWNNRHISAIEVVADEKLDIEGRANFYEQTGALRDLIQSHLLHVMSVVMMEKPADITDSDAIHSSRLNLLNSIESVPADQLAKRALRGQYDGYRAEVDNDKSNMETFAALKLYSRLEAWRNVPIYLRSGKALSAKRTAVTVSFKPEAGDHDHANQLTFNIQPNEGIELQLWVKRPGFERRLQTAPMSFRYDQTFDEHGHPDAYERVLVDAIRGNHTLFATSDEVLSAWRIIEPVITAWSQDGADLKTYAKGSAGPDLSSLEEAD
ncbi:MAG TPA: glucose-6-phosphate dehydrogenase [Candidatus Saccharimonadales bacterium]|nr:glucose-6-phosphate dehydrogenase [Candidatus Saccharimonadales bacterium]